MESERPGQQGHTENEPEGPAGPHGGPERHRTRRLWRRPALWVVLATLLALSAGFALKSQCTYHEWNDFFQYRHYCYSDIAPIFGIRGLAEDRIPYQQEFWEYPVGTGLFAFSVAKLTTGAVPYLNLTFLLLSTAGALIALALWKMGLPWTRVLIGAAGPTVVVHGLTNWDLLAVAFAVWGMLSWRRGRSFDAALLFGLGGAAKLFPAFFIPFLAVSALKAGDRTQLRNVIVGAVVGFGIPNAVVAARAPENWWNIWTFHGDRAPDFETIWESAIRFFGEQLLPGLGWDVGWTTFVSVVSLVLFVGVLVLLIRRQWRMKLDPLLAGALLTFVFLLTNRVYSPQFTLWAVPLLAIFAAPWTPLIGFVLADLGNFLVRYQLFTTPEGQESGWDQSWEAASRLMVDARWVFLAWCVLAIAKANGIWPRRWSKTVSSRSPGRSPPPIRGSP